MIRRRRPAENGRPSHGAGCGFTALLGLGLVLPFFAAGWGIGGVISLVASR